jgi:uncharacterized coiled-coil DUF342 family protein
MNLEGDVLYKVITGVAGGYLLWAKKKDKEKLDDLAEESVKLKTKQDSIEENVKEIKDDIKTISKDMTDIKVMIARGD